MAFQGMGKLTDTLDGVQATYPPGGASVTAKCLGRGESESPYLTGSFVIASLTETSPANEDATYSGSLENSGPVTVTESALS